ncbi:MAG TPA: hypothetical protein VMT34_18305 [Aggregatilineales bacterium]|nr:hypothetical protein [Aggregatilineales bacterium]
MRLETYRFWAPLDQKFMQGIAKLAADTDIEFVSFLWGTNFFGDLDYQPQLDTLSYKDVRQMFNRAVSGNLGQAVVSSTGAYYPTLIAAYGKS